MLAKNYTHEITNTDKGGFLITLTCINGKQVNKQKTFFLATSTLAGITSHMESLTDVCCDELIK